jgi:hypothetical protein
MKKHRVFRYRLFAEQLESREVPSGNPIWGGYGNNAQHTGLSSVASQPLQTIRWSTPVDLNPQYSGTDLFIHYGAASVTQANTVIVPVKTGASGNFEVNAYEGSNGTLLWSQPTDYIVPSSGWTPSFSGVLTSANRYYFPGAGGTLDYIDNVDTPGATITGQVAFYGEALYQANKAAFDGAVEINTPITTDDAGDLFFGFIVLGSNPANLQSGIARVDSNGTGTWVSASTAANDGGIVSVQYNSAPALSNDQKSLYVAVNAGDFQRGDLLKLDSTTLATQAQVTLIDPESGGNASLPDISTASPTIGPDGDVYFGVLENPFPENNDRGWLLHFSGDLSVQKISGAFGWDDTVSIVPPSMVPGYTGTSAYLIMTKYNDYIGFNGSTGQNKVAVLDPNATETDPVTGVTVMNEVHTVLGQTPNPNGGVDEWCINNAAVDPATDSILVNSEDGHLYRWSMVTNTLSEAIRLTVPTGEAYTSTIVGADGSVYAINNAVLWAVGVLPSVSANSSSAAKSPSATVNGVFTVTLTNGDSQASTVDFTTADGTAIAGKDYTTTTGTLTFPPGTSTQQITVPLLPDANYGPSLNFHILLSNSGNSTISGADGLETILNPLPPPALTPAAASVTASTNGKTSMTFQVNMSTASELTTTVDYSTSDGTAVAGQDYTASKGVLTIAPGATSGTVTVPVLPQTIYGPPISFNLNLNDPTNGTVGTAQAVGTILNPVPQPSLSIGNVAALTAMSGLTPFTFTVSLSAPSKFQTTVAYATADGTAVAGTDYQSAQGTLTFAPGVTTQTFTVNTLPLTVNAPAKQFTVNLSGATNATIGVASGTATILNPVPPPKISVDNVSLAASPTSATPFTFTITLSTATEQTVTAIYYTADNTAVAGVDYVATSGQLTFAPLQTSQTVTVMANPANGGQPSKSFFLELTGLQNASAGLNQGVGTIEDLTGALSIAGNVTHTNVTKGTIAYAFTVSLGFAVAQPVTVTVSTADGSAVAPGDYTALPPTVLTFAPGQTSQQVTVNVNGTALAASTKTFFVNLSNPSNAILLQSQGVGTILSGVVAGTLQLETTAYTVLESAGTVTVNVRRRGGSAGGVSVGYSTSDGPGATAGVDYVPASGTVSFGAGQSSAPIVIQLLNNGLISGPKQFSITLSNPQAGASLVSPTTAVITINNNNGSPNELFVIQLYRDLLGRQADPGSLIAWTNAMNAGLSQAAVVAAFQSSLEYQAHVIDSLYETYLGRHVDPLGLSNDLQFLARTPLIPGSGDPIAELRINLLGSEEYFLTRGGGTSAGFLSALYHDVLGRGVDPIGAQVFGTALAGGEATSLVAQTILYSQEGEQDFVNGAYVEFLRRNADPVGLNVFASALQQGQSELTVWAALVSSGEYYNRAQVLARQ